jgi:photosystem I P700 chlorophyll a apoprotein A1
MYAMPPYPYIATDYATQLIIHTYVVGGFCVVGGSAQLLSCVRDYTPL